MGILGLIVLLIGWVLIKSFDISLFKKKYQISTSRGLLCQGTMRCDGSGCEEGTQYGKINCLFCLGISDEILWVKSCQKCNNSRLLRILIGKCKKCQGNGFLSYGPYFQVTDDDFPEGVDWEVALNVCSSLGDGWRLPTIEELQGMYLLHKEDKQNYQNRTYWSRNRGNSMTPWDMNFINGSVTFNGFRGKKNQIRAVRDLI